MKTREQNRNNKRTEIERFDWCIERIQTHLGFGWLSERSGKQTSCPKNFLEIALTSYCNTIGQSNNAFSMLGFLWRENEESMLCSFHPLADKTNNKHLRKPFFKVIRKSLYLSFFTGKTHYVGWSLWSSWGWCSSSCGKGTQHRFRYCLSVSTTQDKESSCEGKALMSRSCAPSPCPGMSTDQVEYSKKPRVRTCIFLRLFKHGS